MPRYFFDIKNGHRLIDPAGLVCTGDDDAVAKAKVIAAQIAQDTTSAEGQRNIAVMDTGTRPPVDRTRCRMIDPSCPVRTGLGRVCENHPVRDPCADRSRAAEKARHSRPANPCCRRSACSRRHPSGPRGESRPWRPARHVLDDDGLAEVFAHALCPDPGQHVRRAPGGCRDDERERPVGEVLRGGGVRGQKNSRDG